MPASSPTARRVAVAAATTLACAAALAPSAASAAARPAAGTAPTVTAAAWAAGRAAHGPNATVQQAIEAYWTPARMRSARPVEELPEYANAATTYTRQSLRAKQRAARSRRGRPFSVAPRAGRRAPAFKRAAYNPNYGSSQIPAYTNGKIFFTTPSGGTGACSGAIVNSPGADTVWTAGHCLHSGKGGGWYANWAFVPGYDDDLANPRPWGTWTPWWVQTRPAWASNSDFSEDMGVMVMNTNFGGWHIVNYFGGHGFRANQSRYGYENLFGYPALYPFDGGNLMRCWGYASTESDWTYGASTWDAIGVRCDFNQGASGGPWLMSFDGNWGFLNGVNSRRVSTSTTTIVVTPYFDNTAVDLYNITANM